MGASSEFGGFLFPAAEIGGGCEKLKFAGITRL